MPQRQLMTRNVKPSTIQRIDIMVGGDHGIGDFIAGAKVVVVVGDDESGSDPK